MDTRGQDLYFLGSLVKESFRRHDLDVSQEEVGEICSLLGDLNGVDAAEIFSPLRDLAGSAVASDCSRD